MVEVGSLVVVVTSTGITPQRDWPMITSPRAVGPLRNRWTAFTVIESSSRKVSSLNTIVKVSPIDSMVPFTSVLGAGVPGTGTVVSSPVTFGSP